MKARPLAGGHAETSLLELWILMDRSYSGTRSDSRRRARAGLKIPVFPGAVKDVIVVNMDVGVGPITDLRKRVFLGPAHRQLHSRCSAPPLNAAEVQRPRARERLADL